jgi:hypothetical protein
MSNILDKMFDMNLSDCLAALVIIITFLTFIIKKTRIGFLNFCLFLYRKVKSVIVFIRRSIILFRLHRLLSNLDINSEFIIDKVKIKKQTLTIYNGKNNIDIHISNSDLEMFSKYKLSKWKKSLPLSISLYIVDGILFRNEDVSKFTREHRLSKYLHDYINGIKTPSIN